MVPGNEDTQTHKLKWITHQTKSDHGTDLTDDYVRVVTGPPVSGVRPVPLRCPRRTSTRVTCVNVLCTLWVKTTKTGSSVTREVLRCNEGVFRRVEINLEETTTDKIKVREVPGPISVHDPTRLPHMNPRPTPQSLVPVGQKNRRRGPPPGTVVIVLPPRRVSSPKIQRGFRSTFSSPYVNPSGYRRIMSTPDSGVTDYHRFGLSLRV